MSWVANTSDKIGPRIVQDNGQYRIKVERGDTLYEISRAVKDFILRDKSLNVEMMWKKIQSDNGGIDPKKLKVGMELRIDVESLKECKKASVQVKQTASDTESSEVKKETSIEDQCNANPEQFSKNSAATSTETVDNKGSSNDYSILSTLQDSFEISFDDLNKDENRGVFKEIQSLITSKYQNALTRVMGEEYPESGFADISDENKPLVIKGVIELLSKENNWNLDTSKLNKPIIDRFLSDETKDIDGNKIISLKYFSNLRKYVKLDDIFNLKEYGYLRSELEQILKQKKLLGNDYEGLEIYKKKQKFSEVLGTLLANNGIEVDGNNLNYIHWWPRRWWNNESQLINFTPKMAKKMLELEIDKNNGTH